MIYLGLGSNQGERRAHLSRAIEQLEQNGFSCQDISPVVESPALLKADAKPEWNRPYLNLVIGGTTNHKPHELLKLAKKTELALGRDLSASRWSPRPIDIDILLWHDEKIDSQDLLIPHPEMYKRAFVITPLLHIAPHIIIPGINLSALQISQQILPIPLWMGIVNLTPDSFSDGGENESLETLERQLNVWITAGVHILDFGAESTRPNARPVPAILEQQRLAGLFPILERLRQKHTLMPLISIDTQHINTAEFALERGADWINDVTGLGDTAMLELLKTKQATGIAMHSLSVPVKSDESMDPARPVVLQLLEWLDVQSQKWASQGLETAKLIFDPGVGFGKTASQNLDIIKATASLRKQGFRLLVGHSRKSFMNNFSSNDFADRDLETLGLSMVMCEQGVDIVRVHDPLSHIRAYRAWSHAHV